MSMDCVLIGKLDEDCRELVTDSGKVLQVFRVASFRGFQEAEQIDYIECIAFAPKLDNQKANLRRGVSVKVCGHLQTREVKGLKYMQRFNLVVDSLEFLWGRKLPEGEKQ